MCGHSTSANKIIQQLLHELYPAIQHQFVLIGAYPASHHSHLQELITDLKNEFQSLVTYENKLVFSSVLKVFNSENEDVSHLPNIEDLQQLTLHKEHRISSLIKEIEQEVSTLKVSEKQKLSELISLFKNEFRSQKMKWNTMISNWLTSCNCFRRISNQFNK